MNHVAQFSTLRTAIEHLDATRRELQGLSANAQRLSKQAIFSLQRGDAARATDLLNEADVLYKQGDVLVKKEPRLHAEGIWRASLEENAEARFFERAIQGRSLFAGRQLKEEPDIVLGGLSDCVGELVRQATLAATSHDAKRVEMLYAIGLEIVDFLTSLDLTGPLRSKGDQARSHLRRFEEIRYDLSLRSY
ncbi:hypothetical protein KBC54_00795 [Patescibacteria group bacterium]|nr:hypothetical protein [Patescibacteria group bacterium]